MGLLYFREIGMFFKKFFIGVLWLCVSATAVQAETITHNGVTYGTVTSPHTGRVWLDRNLGASRVCTAYNDSACYGNYYQWGRGTDGHEKSNSTTTSTQAIDVNNAGSNFIKGNSDWASTDSDGRIRSANWSKTDGSSVCPIGYVVPKITEFIAENISGKIDSYDKLKLPSSGWRYGEYGDLRNRGSYEVFWTSSQPILFRINSGEVEWYGSSPWNGLSIRCIKAQPTIIPNTGSDQTTTIGQPVTLSASQSSDSDGQIVSYEWKEGNTILSTDENFTKIDFGVGVHTITLTVTDDDNNSASDEVVVTVEWSVEAITDIALPQTVADTLQADVEKVYRFTLYDRSTLVVDAGETTAVALHGYAYDANGTKVSDIADWSKGKNNQLKIEKVLDAGTYILKIFAGVDGAFSMEVKTYVADPDTPWSVLAQSQYTIHKNKLFTKTFRIEKNRDDVDYENLIVTVDGSADVYLDVQKKDDKGNALDEYRYKLVGSTLANSTDITLHIADSSSAFSVDMPVHLKVGNFEIKNLMPSNPFIIANGDDVTYPLNIVFDAIIPTGSSVLPSCSITIPFNGAMKTIDLDITEVGSGNNRYRCRTHTDYQNGYYLSTLSKLDEVAVSLGFSDQAKAYKTLTVPMFKRDLLTAKATLEYLWEYTGGLVARVKYPIYVIVNKRVYRPGDIGFPKVIYLGGENAYAGIRKFNKDTVFMQGGIWRLSYMGHSIIIELSENGSNISKLAFTVDGTQDLTEYGDIVKFITNPDSFYHMLVSSGRLANGNNVIQYLLYGHILNGTGKGQFSIAIRECENMYDPLTQAEALEYFSHPCVTNADITDENSNDYFNDYGAGVRGTTFTIEKESNQSLVFNLIEGEIELSSSSLDGNITLHDMESLDIDHKVKTTITTNVLSPLQEQHLADTSLNTADENTSIGSINVTTNLSNASYVLVGDNVQAGNGKVSVFEEVAEGSYVLQFLPILGFTTPEKIDISLAKTNLHKVYAVVYKVDNDNDGVPDSLDAFPNNANESVDTDHDGIGNNADTDDDNDGVLDVNDALPLNPNESVDTDHDGIGNNADRDDDNDGISDVLERTNGLNPLNASDGEADFDHDGFSNALEISVGTDIRSAGSKPIWTPVMMGDTIMFVPAKP